MTQDDVLVGLTKTVRECVRQVAEGDESEATTWARRLEESGFMERQHEGDDPESFKGNPRKGVEWYGGQFIHMVRQQQWFAVNSWLNCVDKFAPEIKS